MNPNRYNSTVVLVVTRTIVEGVHGGQRIALDNLGPGLNIVVGKNGTGKTTLLHILANLLEDDFERFFHLYFKNITVETSANNVIEVQQSRDAGKVHLKVIVDGELVCEGNNDSGLNLEKELLPSLFGGRPVYLPAFRSILEAASSRRVPSPLDNRTTSSDREFQRIVDHEREIGRHEVSNRNRYYLSHFFRERCHWVASKTIMCRDWFGQFVPVIRYPSIIELEKEILEEVGRANTNMSSIDQATLRAVISHVLSIATGTGSIGNDKSDGSIQKLRTRLQELLPADLDIPELQRIFNVDNSHPDQAYSDSQSIVQDIMAVYERAITERDKLKQKEFSSLDTFISSVNLFLKNKELQINVKEANWRRSSSPVAVRLGSTGNGAVRPLIILSSGERHVLTLLFCATHMAPTDGVVLLDEPELSLHVEWQRIILGEMQKQAGKRQIIACTHAPEVAAEHIDFIRHLQMEPWQQSEVSTDEQCAIDEEIEL